jgi:hypothetical protein
VGILGTILCSNHKENGVNTSYWRPRLIPAHGFQLRANSFQLVHTFFWLIRFPSNYNVDEVVPCFMSPCITRFLQCGAPGNSFELATSFGQLV